MALEARLARRFDPEATIRRLSCDDALENVHKLTASVPISGLGVLTRGDATSAAVSL
jgi:hypothetical protein